VAMKTMSPNTLSANVKIVSGEIALDGTNPTVVNTELTTIYGAAVSLKQTGAPGVTATTVTYNTSGGTLNIYAWKPTGSGDATLIAATDTDPVGYVVMGT